MRIQWLKHWNYMRRRFPWGGRARRPVNVSTPTRQVLPWIVRLTLAWAVSPGTDGTAPTHLYTPALSYDTACIDRVPSWESTSEPWRNTEKQSHSWCPVLSFSFCFPLCVNTAERHCGYPVCWESTKKTFTHSPPNHGDIRSKSVLHNKPVSCNPTQRLLSGIFSKNKACSQHSSQWVCITPRRHNNRYKGYNNRPDTRGTFCT